MSVTNVSKLGPVRCRVCGNCVPDEAVLFRARSLMGRIRTKKKAASCQANGRLGGRPRKKTGANQTTANTANAQEQG